MKKMHSFRYNEMMRLRSGDDEASFTSTGAKILVVEYSPAQRKMMIQRLKNADESWDIYQAENGEDALSKLKASLWRFDVVVVHEYFSLNDGLMGRELVTLIRRQSKMSMCVIIACISNPADSWEDLKSVGVDYVWSKPLPASNEIKLTIDELLQIRIRASMVETQSVRAPTGTSAKSNRFE